MINLHLLIEYLICRYYYTNNYQNIFTSFFSYVLYVGTYLEYPQIKM